MRIGHIITDEKLKAPLFTEVSRPNTSKINPDELTLIIGKDVVKAMYPDFELRYLNRKISDNVYWTFSKYEKRNMHDEDIESFRKLVFSTIRKRIRYVPLNFLSNSYTYAKSAVKTLFGDEEKVVMQVDRSVYILIGYTVYGVYVDELSYIGLSDAKIANTIGRLKNARFVYSLDFLKGKERDMGPGGIKYIPYLLKRQTVKSKTSQ